LAAAVAGRRPLTLCTLPQPRVIEIFKFNDGCSIRSKNFFGLYANFDTAMENSNEIYAHLE
jgi:hypothetical protein